VVQQLLEEQEIHLQQLHLKGFLVEAVDIVDQLTLHKVVVVDLGPLALVKVQLLLMELVMGVLVLQLLLQVHL
jgi:hypothetical protein